MKWALVLCLATAACQQGSTSSPAPAGAPTPAARPSAGSSAGSNTMIISLPKATITPEYKADISNLCNGLQLSGAIDKPKDERWVALAMWLGPNIKTEAGHEFLIAIQPLRGQPKVMALESEATRVGIGACPLADEWRGAAGEAPPAHL